MMHVAPDLSDRELRELERARAAAELKAWLRREAASRDGEMAWYVARTAGRADSAMEALRADGIEAMCPLERKWIRYPRTTKRYSVDIPMFGNHLFVRLLKAESAWVGALSYDCIDCLLGTGETPVPLSEKEIGTILELLAKQGGHASPELLGLAVGDTVVHPVGTFAELRGVVMEIDGLKRSVLIRSMLFGREIETRCGIDDLEKLT